MPKFSACVSLMQAVHIIRNRREQCSKPKKIALFASSKELLSSVCGGIRDEAILLLSSPIFLSSNIFISTYFAQYFAQCCSILLKV